ncbi:MAG: 50S ribosomal protein L11 methyltransferase [Clostridia bacterium]|nr:50S ribosomal protein L11 methyltransferase [Clostridia bacterium]
MIYTDVAARVKTADTEAASAVFTMAYDGGICVEDCSDIAEAAAVMRMDYIDRELAERNKGFSIIHLYLPETEDLSAVTGFIKERFAADGIEYELSFNPVAEEDFANAWKAYYEPVKTGGRITVVPSWKDYEPEDGEIILKMDPEMAFGSGTHESTRLCLGELDKLVRPGCAVLDVGCGSGILAIASVLLGAGSAEACDVDGISVETAKRNCEKNGVSVKTYRSDLFSAVAGRFDVICANIVADIIIRMAPEIKAHMNAGGVFLCSGIIAERAGEVRGALEANGLTVLRTDELNGWAAIVAE